MLGKLAVRNTKRSIKDYLIYLITITISFSLILAFNLIASSDKVVELSTGMGSFKTVLTFINAVIVFVVCFLINYTTRFMFEKRSKELGTYMLLGIKKKKVAHLLVTENILLGFLAFVLSIPLGFLFSQFVSLVIVKMLGIPEVIFISLNLISIELLAIYFMAIYVLVLLNLLRRIRKMTVHDFLYFDKQNEKKMFRSSKRRNIIFVISLLLGIASLVFWHTRFNFENYSTSENISYLTICICVLIISIYGISATCADMFLSVLLKSKKLKYKSDNLFVARTFASKARTMGFTFGTLSMLILLSLLCLNFSSINKGVYQSTIERSSPYDISIYEVKKPFSDFSEYLDYIDDEYTISNSLEYDIYKEPNHQIQNFFQVEFYDFDAILKLSDYNKMLELRGLDTAQLKENEYLIITDKQYLHKVENNNEIKVLQLSNGEKLNLKEIDTQTYWYAMCNSGRFTVVVPDVYTQDLEIAERHLIVDTKEDTTADYEQQFLKDMEDKFIEVNENGEDVLQSYRINMRGTTVEEQNSMTAMIASICLYIAFVLISAVGTILAVQSLSDSTKYKYRYSTLRRIGVNDKSLFRTIKKQLLILFGVPTVYSIICGFFMVVSMNNIFQILLQSKYSYLAYFIGSLLIFFFIYGIYWIATYIGFKRNINEEMIIPELSEPPVRILGATIPENESHIFR